MKPASLLMMVFAGVVLAIWWTFKDVQLPVTPQGAN